jgi:hypothetical protein
MASLPSSEGIAPGGGEGTRLDYHHSSTPVWHSRQQQLVAQQPGPERVIRPAGCCFGCVYEYQACIMSLHAEATPADASGGKGKARTVKTPLQKEVLEAIYQGVPSLSLVLVPCQSSNLVILITHLRLCVGCCRGSQPHAAAQESHS